MTKIHKVTYEELNELLYGFTPILQWVLKVRARSKQEETVNE
jgi:hypothetical protein